MLGPSPLAKGGISTLVSAYDRHGFLDRWSVAYFVLFNDGSYLRKLALVAAAVPRFLAMLATRRVALVHAHTSFNNSFWRKSIFVLPTLLFSRTPVILHFHGGELARFYGERSGPIRRFLIRFMLDRASYVVVLSKQLGGALRRVTDNRNVVEIENFIDAPELFEVDGTGSEPIVLFLGQLIPSKGIYELLEAMARVRGDVPDAQLVCCGEGELEHVSQRIEELNLQKHVVLAGWVTGKVKTDLMARAAVFVLPSHHEALPFALLEAMAAGKAIVVARVGGVVDVIEDGVDGILIDARDAEGMAREIVRLLRDRPLRGLMGSRAREKIRARYSAGSALAKLSRLYQAAGAVPNER